MAKKKPAQSGTSSTKAKTRVHKKLGELLGLAAFKQMNQRLAVEWVEPQQRLASKATRSRQRARRSGFSLRCHARNGETA